jgi:hypothetical protein
VELLISYHMRLEQQWLAVKQALLLVRHLLQGCEDDASVLDDLVDLLEDGLEELKQAASHEKCTGLACKAHCLASFILSKLLFAYAVAEVMV